MTILKKPQTSKSTCKASGLVIKQTDFRSFIIPALSTLTTGDLIVVRKDSKKLIKSKLGRPKTNKEGGIERYGSDPPEKPTWD